MASLLGWFNWDESEPDPRVWSAMRERAAQRSRYPGAEHGGAGWRVWSAATTRLDLPTLQWQLDDSGQHCPVLIDRPLTAEPRADAKPASWSAATLMDDTPTAAILFDPSARKVWACRDRMGQRVLVWALVPGGVILASGEHVLRAHPAVSADFDYAWLAAFVAALPADPESTVWRGVRCLAAGQARSWKRSGTSATCMRLEPDPSWERCTESQLQEQFEGLLAASVDRSTCGAGRVGVSLSAGMDSSAVAAIVSARCSGKRRPLAVTYGFEQWPAIDERREAAALALRLDIEHSAIAVDEMRPYRLQCKRPISPDTPIQTPYREWKEAAYRSFVAGGVDVVLSGNFSDHLWAPPGYWLAEALRHGRWQIITATLDTIYRDCGLRGLLRNWGVRAMARPWRLRQVTVPQRLGVLAPRWREQVRASWEAQAAPLRCWPRPSQAMSVLSSSSSFDAGGEDWFAARHALAYRQPFRDAALTTWMLSVPADLSYRGRRWKWLMRRSMSAKLPSTIVDRPKSSDLRPYARMASECERERLVQLAAPATHLLDELLAGADPGHIEPTDRMWISASLGSWLAEVVGAEVGSAMKGFS